MLFHSSFARSIWSVIQVASNLYPPSSVANIFGNWLHGIDVKFRILLRVGAITLIWSIWLCRNDKVFNDKNFSLMQVIYRCTHLLHSWSSLHRVEFRDLFMEVSIRLEDAVRDFFIPHGWRHSFRIDPPASYAFMSSHMILVIHLIYLFILVGLVGLCALLVM